MKMNKQGMAIAIAATTGLIGAMGVGVWAFAPASVDSATTAAAGSTPKPPCWAGSWEVASAKTTVADNGMSYTVTGGSGIKLKLSTVTKGATASFNFRKTKPQTGTGVVKGSAVTASLQLDGKLTITFVVGGDTKGKLALKQKTGTGDATYALKLGQNTTSGLLTSQIAKNREQGAIPRKGSFTCVKDTSLKIVTAGKSGSLLATTEWVLKHS